MCATVLAHVWQRSYLDVKYSRTNDILDIWFKIILDQPAKLLIPNWHTYFSFISARQIPCDQLFYDCLLLLKRVTKTWGTVITWCSTFSAHIINWQCNSQTNHAISITTKSCLLFKIVFLFIIKLFRIVEIIKGLRISQLPSF